MDDWQTFEQKEPDIVMENYLLCESTYIKLKNSQSYSMTSKKSEKQLNFWEESSDLK